MVVESVVISRNAHAFHVRRGRSQHHHHHHQSSDQHQYTPYGIRHIVTFLLVGVVAALTFKLFLDERTDFQMVEDDTLSLIMVFFRSFLWALVSYRVITVSFLLWILCFVVWPYLYPRVEEESMTVVRGLGIQLERRFRDGEVTHQFVEQSRIKAIVINEGFRCFEVIFYLAFMMHENNHAADGEKAEMILPFQYLYPKLEFLKEVTQYTGFANTYCSVNSSSFDVYKITREMMEQTEHDNDDEREISDYDDSGGGSADAYDIDDSSSPLHDNSDDSNNMHDDGSILFERSTQIIN